MFREREAKLLSSALAKLIFTGRARMSDLKRVAIVGSGIMGSGIAQVCAQSGMDVRIVDQSDLILEQSMKNIEKNLSRTAKKLHAEDPMAKSFVKDALMRISPHLDLKKAVSDCDIVIEAVAEHLNMKQTLFTAVEAATSSVAILSSNTSSLPLSEIGENLKVKQRFAGIHFFNPVSIMKLVEVVKTPFTSMDTVETLVKFCRTLSKVPIVCKDTPGFVVNRLLIPYMMEALRMVERGDASMKDVDTAMKLGAGYPMGPFELFDYTGLDTCKFIIDGWHSRFPDDPMFKQSDLLNNLVEQKKLGRKTGEGFYKY
ncbi:unnamed protein product [Soboliphyme baturini]|uniref:3-hydroxyacyl-CoA dehydrogenase n=1 Tax=Soboliphyme baturini TaxID=241478 RepID=A0A183IGT4_9BILA|nr:unnamed protein product [Soboliphyme baturini]